MQRVREAASVTVAQAGTTARRLPVACPSSVLCAVVLVSLKGMAVFVTEALPAETEAGKRALVLALADAVLVSVVPGVVTLAIEAVIVSV